MLVLAILVQMEASLFSIILILMVVVEEEQLVLKLVGQEDLGEVLEEEVMTQVVKVTNLQ